MQICGSIGHAILDYVASPWPFELEESVIAFLLICTKLLLLNEALLQPAFWLRRRTGVVYAVLVHAIFYVPAIVVGWRRYDPDEPFSAIAIYLGSLELENLPVFFAIILLACYWYARILRERG